MWSSVPATALSVRSFRILRLDVQRHSAARCRRLLCSSLRRNTPLQFQTTTHYYRTEGHRLRSTASSRDDFAAHSRNVRCQLDTMDNIRFLFNLRREHWTVRQPDRKFRTDFRHYRGQGQIKGSGMN